MEANQWGQSMAQLIRHQLHTIISKKKSDLVANLAHSAITLITEINNYIQLLLQ